MKAFRYSTPAAGLQLQQVPVPEPGPGQALVAVKAAGLCHSDCHILKGQGEAWLAKKPITLGHEVAGIVVKVGPGHSPSPVRTGDRVAIGYYFERSQQGGPDSPPGLGYDGGFAEYVVANVTSLIKIPEGVSFEQAAVAMDSVATGYHAVVQANATRDSTIAIVGLGGLGTNGLATALAKGAKVYAVDTNNEKIEEAKRAGAVDGAVSLSAFKHVTFDAIVDFVGGSVTADAVSIVKPGGIVVLVGLGADTINVPAHLLVTRYVTLKGSMGATFQELKDVLDLIAAGVFNLHLEEIDFDDIPKGYERLEKNAVPGRLFTRPTQSVEL
ncbi:alcohol dehydrogenase [Diplodia corticola]|uniref:Alcohol dehydrogenase n=1 Tax=Diplodia corticola TaxID=236234 RepID=A0A1J9QNP4_9PEZI|nr:alcohol dehydrogenase [Diplodia corticola]OJD29682.1 alcohol dehydrogenase [Diplodia corticola]